MKLHGKGPEMMKRITFDYFNEKKGPLKGIMSLPRIVAYCRKNGWDCTRAFTRKSQLG